MRKLICLLLLLTALPASADVYRWVDAAGVVHYSDSPPAPGAKPTTLPKLQPFSPQALASGQPVSAPGAAPTANASGYRPVISSPAPDETLRDNTSSVTISVAAGPPNFGDMLVYYVDGSPRGAATTATSTQVDGIERGSHTAQVAAVTAQGAEYARSATVTFHMKQPMVQQNRPNSGKKK